MEPFEKLPAAGSPLGRRQVLKIGLGAGIGAGLAPVLALGQDDPARMRPQIDDRLVKDNSATPLVPDDVPLADHPIFVWPMDPASRVVRSDFRLNSILLIRLPADSLSPETQAMAVEGVVALSGLCPHGGCEVSAWIPERGQLLCDCHSSYFDPKTGGTLIDGPTARSLPALPLKLIDGQLAVAKPFTAPIVFDE